MPVRLAEVADIGAVEGIIQAAYQPYIERIGRRPAPMDDDYAPKVHKGVVFVWDDEGVVGVVVLITAPDHLLVENVAVDPRRQREGIGRMLLAYAETRARAAGLTDLRLYPNAAMTENRALYSHLGYVEDGRRTDDGFARVFFRKPVSP